MRAAHACACCCCGSCRLEGQRLERTDVKLRVAVCDASSLRRSRRDVAAGGSNSNESTLQMKSIPWLSYSLDCVSRLSRYRGH